MAQRNPMNERYSDENRGGSTRKSSASAKPKSTRAATLREPAPKTKKQKKQEARERARKAQERATMTGGVFESTDTYKQLRRRWWVVLGGAVALTIASFVGMRIESLQQVSVVTMIVAYALIAYAFYIDLGKIRKARRQHVATSNANKSKEARKELKRARAEQREKERAEAEQKAQEPEAQEEEQPKKGLFGCFGKKGKAESANEADAANGASDSDKAASSEKANAANAAKAADAADKAQEDKASA